MILLPTKGRPLSLKRFATHYELTGCTLPVLLLIDQNDAYQGTYDNVAHNFDDMTVPAGTPIGECFNLAFRQYPDEPFYGITADDVVPETPEWDVKLRDACLPDRVSWGDDGIQGENLPTHPFLGGDLVRRMGYIAPPGVKHWYADNFWKLLATVNGRGSYLPEVKTTHRHPLKGLAETDATYKNQPDHEEDRKAWALFLATGYQDLRRRLAA